VAVPPPSGSACVGERPRVLTVLPFRGQVAGTAPPSRSHCYWYCGPAWANRLIARRDRVFFTFLCWGDPKDAVGREIIRKGLLTEQHYNERLLSLG
jgi:hypothetical protein